MIPNLIGRKSVISRSYFLSNWNTTSYYYIPAVTLTLGLLVQHFSSTAAAFVITRNNNSLQTSSSFTTTSLRYNQQFRQGRQQHQPEKLLVHNMVPHNNDNNKEETTNKIKKKQKLVLIGGGHAHAQVIKALNVASRPKQLDVSLIDIQKSASYSGMVPGCISNLYTPNDTLLELEPLSKWAGITFYNKRVIDIDLEKKLVYVEDVVNSSSSSEKKEDDENKESVTTTIPFDAISIDIGSASRALNDIEGAKQYTIPTRPISELVTRFEDETIKIQQQVSSNDHDDSILTTSPIHVIVIGGGAAGIELSMSIMGRWNPIFENNNNNNNRPVRVTLLDSGTKLLPNEPLAIQQTIRQLLMDRGIDINHNCIVQEVQKDRVLIRRKTATVTRSSSSSSSSCNTKDLFFPPPIETLKQQQQEENSNTYMEEWIPFTHCIYATGAGAHELAYKLGTDHGLAITKNGWISVNKKLQSISHPFVFAAGDCASIENIEEEYDDEEEINAIYPPPKAGVYAVRAGPILIQNLVSYLINDNDDENNHQNNEQANNNNNLIKYYPQNDFLKLMVCGDGKAFGSRFGIPMYGKWVWELKDKIDTNFMNLFKVENLPELVVDEEEKSSSSKLDTSQYDAVDKQSRPKPMKPKDAANYLQRIDNDVDYNIAWNILRDMNDNENNYQNEVLQYIDTTTTKTTTTAKATAGTK